MKRSLLCLLLAGCATTGKTPHVFKSAGGPTYSTVDLMESAPSPAPVGVTRLARQGGKLLQSTDGASFASLGGGSANPWAAAAQAALQAAVPTATMCEYVQPAVMPFTINSQSVPNAPIQGGAVGVNNSTGTYVTWTQQFQQSASGGPWAIAWRGSFPTAASGKFAFAGMYNNTTAHGVTLGANFATDATHLVLQIVGGATTALPLSVAADLNVHDWRIVFNGTTIVVIQDGATVLTTSTLTNLVSDAVGFAQFSSTGMTPSYGAAVGMLEYCYVPTAPFAQADQLSYCLWPDGTSTPGTCVMDDEFSGTTLDPRWTAHDDYSGPLMLSTGDACFRHENVSVSGGFLHLAITSNTRSPCPQTWTPTAFYNSNYGASYPVPHTTHFDISYIDLNALHGTYGHLWVRLRGTPASGSWTDVSLWGTNCQSPTMGLIGMYLDGFFAHNGACRFPAAGSEEIDMPTVENDSNLIAYTHYTYDHNGAPFYSSFFSVPYYGTQYNSSDFFGHASFSNPTANFHVYEVDWRGPTATVSLSETIYKIDGVLVGQDTVSAPSWQITNPLFLALWTSDLSSLNATDVGAGKEATVDYVRIGCDPDQTCTWTT